MSLPSTPGKPRIPLSTAKAPLFKPLGWWFWGSVRLCPSRPREAALRAEACLVSVLGRVCPLDRVKCSFEITSCSESQSILNLLTCRMSSESLMGNIKYHCWPWNDALGVGGAGYQVRQAEGAALKPTEEEDRCSRGSGPGRRWVGGGVLGAFAALRGQSSAQDAPAPPTIFPPPSWLKLPTDQAPHQHGSHTLM